MIKKGYLIKKNKKNRVLQSTKKEQRRKVKDRNRQLLSVELD